MSRKNGQHSLDNEIFQPQLYRSRGNGMLNVSCALVWKILERNQKVAIEKIKTIPPLIIKKGNFGMFLSSYSLMDDGISVCFKALQISFSVILTCFLRFSDNISSG